VPALDAGMRLLARRAHSRAELRQKLARRGYEPDEVAAAMVRLDELGYLNDGAYARAMVALRSGLRGRRLIAAELAQRGVGRETVQEALVGLEPAGELAAARRLAGRMLAVERSPLDRKALARIGSRLMRRGFSREVAAAACAQAEPDAAST
jgi:regulatory protein